MPLSAIINHDPRVQEEKSRKKCFNLFSIYVLVFYIFFRHFNKLAFLALWPGPEFWVKVDLHLRQKSCFVSLFLRKPWKDYLLFLFYVFVSALQSSILLLLDNIWDDRFGSICLRLIPTASHLNPVLLTSRLMNVVTW